MIIQRVTIDDNTDRFTIDKIIGENPCPFCKAEDYKHTADCPITKNKEELFALIKTNRELEAKRIARIDRMLDWFEKNVLQI